MKSVKTAVGALFVGTALFAASFTGVSAAPNQNQDGLVNVAVGDVTILEDVRVGVAAQVAATLCNVKVGPIAVLATQVDATGVTGTACTTENGPVTITQ
jgi:hypothetical protein